MTFLALYGREAALRRLSLPRFYAVASTVLLDQAPVLRARRLEPFRAEDLWVRARTDRWYADLALVDAVATARTVSLALCHGLFFRLPALRRRERRWLLGAVMPLALRPWLALALLVHGALPLALELVAGSSGTSRRPFAPPLRSTRDAVLQAWTMLTVGGMLPIVVVSFPAGPDRGSSVRVPFAVGARVSALLFAVWLAPRGSAAPSVLGSVGGGVDRVAVLALALAYGLVVELALLVRALRWPAAGARWSP